MPHHTTVDNLRNMAKEIGNMMEDLLLMHSSIFLWNNPHEVISVVPIDGNYAFKELTEEGRHIQAKLLEEYQKFYSILISLLRQQPKDTIKTLEKTDQQILSIIKQQFTRCRDTQEALIQVRKALDEQVNLLR